MKLSSLILTALWSLPACTSPLQRTSRDPGTLSGKWTDLPAISSGPFQEHGTIATSTDIYAIGGIPVTDGGIIPAVTTVEAFSIADGTWRSVAPLPLALNHPNTAIVDGKVYVLGGLVSYGNETVWRAVPNCFVYDTTEDAWTELPPMAADQARGASAVGVLGQTIYLAGGMTSLEYVAGGLQASVDTVTSYSVESGTWTTLPSIPERRDHVGGAVIGETFYAVGGRDHGQANVAGTVYAMDLTLDSSSWTTKSPMPTPRGGLSIGVIGDCIVTFGGEGNQAPESNGVFNETEAYNVREDAWYQLGAMAHPRHGTAAAAVNGRIYIPGGGIRLGASPVDTFDVFELF